MLALYAEGALRGTTLVGLVGKHGQRARATTSRSRATSTAGSRAEFKRLGIKADADAARALVELVGDDTIALSNEIEKLG